MVPRTSWRCQARNVAKRKLTLETGAGPPRESDALRRLQAGPGRGQVGAPAAWDFTLGMSSGQGETRPPMTCTSTPGIKPQRTRQARRDISMAECQPDMHAAECRTPAWCGRGHKHRCPVPSPQGARAGRWTTQLGEASLPTRRRAEKWHNGRLCPVSTCPGRVQSVSSRARRGVSVALWSYVFWLICPLE